jgi:hypothetical protein
VFIDKTPESNYFPYLLPLFPLLYLDSPASSHTSVTSFGYLVPTVWPRPEALPEPETSLDRWAGGERYKKTLVEAWISDIGRRKGLRERARATHLLFLVTKSFLFCRSSDYFISKCMHAEFCEQLF